MQVPVFPSQYHSTNAPYSCCSYQKDKRANLGTFQNTNAVGNWGRLRIKLHSLIQVNCLVFFRLGRERVNLLYLLMLELAAAW